MSCIHGLEEGNCPDCRILKSTMPFKGLNPQETRLINITNSLFQKNRNLDERVKKDLLMRRLDLTPNLLNRVPHPTLINDIPKFENRVFLKRINELDITKEDVFGITKKIPLEQPGWRFEEED